MQEDIIVGAIDIIAAKRKVDHVLVEGCALPGQRFTEDRNTAMVEAVRLNKGVQEYRGRHGRR